MAPQGKRAKVSAHCSRMVTFRLPLTLEKALKEEAESRGRRWQTVMKELLEEALGLAGSSTEVKRVPATALHAATRRLKQRDV